MSDYISVLLLKSDDWEGLYLDGVLIDEGHTLEEGEERVVYFVKLSDEYEFDLHNLRVKWLSDEDDEFCKEEGCFPKTLSEFKYLY